MTASFQIFDNELFTLFPPSHTVQYELMTG